MTQNITNTQEEGWLREAEDVYTINDDTMTKCQRRLYTYLKPLCEDNGVSVWKGWLHGPVARCRTGEPLQTEYPRRTTEIDGAVAHEQRQSGSGGEWRAAWKGSCCYWTIQYLHTAAWHKIGLYPRSIL